MRVFAKVATTGLTKVTAGKQAGMTEKSALPQAGLYQFAQKVSPCHPELVSGSLTCLFNEMLKHVQHDKVSLWRLFHQPATAFQSL